MSNPVGKKADRSEEIAFLVMEGVLGVQIFLADADGKRGSVDGRWEREGSVGVVEVTGPPAEAEMRAFAIAERTGTQWMESGSTNAYLGTLHKHLSDELTEPWAVANLDKLRRVDAHERHLYLIGRTVLVQEYYARLSDTYESGPMEKIGPLILPEGITDVWFAGRGARGATKLEGVTQWVARYNRKSGWSTHSVTIDERRLPAPRIGGDPAPAGWRLPQRDRTAPSGD